MEILQMIITAFTTPNQKLIDILSIPLTLIETSLILILFTSILNISANLKQKTRYIFINSFICILSRIFISYPFATFINLTVMLITIFIIFKTTILKSCVALTIPFILTVILESIFSKLYLFIFKISYENGYTIPFYRLSILFFVYLTTFFIAIICKSLKFNIHLLDDINKNDKKILIINLILGFISIGTQLYLTIFYSEILPLIITILSSISLITYFFISMYNLTKTMKLEIANQDIENLQLYNKTLSLLHDNIRAFKHDFNNIVQAIGGYITAKDILGLDKYYHQLLGDCQTVKNLDALNPEVINNPSIYSILASKYHKADSKGIKINLEVFLNLNTLNIKIYEFTRILGILLDNSIEAAEECEQKIINVTFRLQEKPFKQLIIIENTYQNKDIDTIKIFEKAYTTKKNNTGLGLWEVNQILNKNNNLELFTHKNNDYFIQELEIYGNKKLLS